MSQPTDRDPVAAERQRLAHALHAGIAQQLTVLSLAIDSALLHDADGRAEQVRAALRTARGVVDAAATDCRRLIGELRDTGDA